MLQEGVNEVEDMGEVTSGAETGVRGGSWGRGGRLRV